MDFVDLVLDMIDNLDAGKKHFRLIDQLESSVTSVPMNIAEGKGRNSKKNLLSFFTLPVDRYTRALHC
jgi:four helix bundle protein